jgi:hypothetical protein
MNAHELADHVASGRRVLALAAPEKRQDVLFQFAREGMRLHTIGHLPKPDVVDAFRDLGLEAGLEETEVQNVLAAAAADPFDPEAVPALRDRDRKLGRVDGSWRSRTFSAAVLQTKTFPEVPYVVPDLLPQGLTILAGKPKIGKSWLALDLCLAVSGDRFCLGHLKPTAGDVLYAALEDNDRRLQRRIGRIMKSESGWPARLTLTTSWRRLDQGGIGDLGDWLQSVTQPRLIVIDTLAGVRRLSATPGYLDDYEALAPLHRLANERGVAILLLHHTRKMDADDPVDTVSGTLGLSGCADTILVLARSSKGTTLYCRGRDIEESERACEFNRETCRWTILGEAEEVQRSEQRQRVIAALEGEMPVADLVSATGIPRNNLEKLLHFMVKDGEIRRSTRGVYAPIAYAR